MAALSTLSLSSLYDLLSWRTIAVLIALWNLKSLPFFWHLRLIYHFCRNWIQKDHVRHSLQTHDGPTHPIFATVSVFSRSPLFEIDYNLHKSNSTFFSDLDMSRTALFIRTFSSGYRIGYDELEGEGKRGNLNPILGAVHTSFKKEISAYQKYEIRSRILSWDKKWLVIGSWFMIPAKDDQPEQLCASALSKYVIKKGRWTVEPEWALDKAGWMPRRPPQDEIDAREESTGSATQNHTDPARQRGILKNSNSSRSVLSRDGYTIGAPIPDSVSRWDAAYSSSNDTARQRRPPPRPEGKGRDWDWYQVDEERRRGLELAKAWLELDQTLPEELQQDYQ